MAQNLPPIYHQAQVYSARARIWVRRNKWFLIMSDREAAPHLLPYVGRRVVVEVLPLVFVEAKLRQEYGYPSIILPSCLYRTWQYLWLERPRRPDLVVRVYLLPVESSQEKPAEGGV